MEYHGTPGNDVIDQEKLNLPDWVSINAEEGDDVVTFGNAIVIGGQGNDKLIGTSALSTIAYWSSPTGIIVNLATNQVNDGFGTIDTLQNIHWVQGSSHDDQFIGGTGDDHFFGGGGNDRFIGGGGADEVSYYFVKSTDAKISYDAATDTFTVKKNFPNGDHGTDVLTGISTIVFGGDGSDHMILTRANFVAKGGFLRNPQITPVTLGANEYVGQFKAGDFDGDGRVDFLVLAQIGYGSADAPMTTYLGDGKGGFIDGTAGIFNGLPKLISGGGRTLIADLNNDQRSDIVQLNFGVDAPPYPGGLNQIYLSSSSTHRLENVTASLEQSLSLNHALSSGDVNNDGYIDLFINSLSSGNALYLNDGTGHFNLRADLIPHPKQGNTNVTNTSSGMVDVNGDGFLDLVLGRWEAASSIPNSQILLNDGHGNFTKNAPIALPASPIPLEIILDVKSIDINGDGLPDMILSITHGGGSATEHDASYYKTAYIQTLINHGNGQFTDETDSVIPASVRASFGQGWFISLTPVDFDHDGKTDMLASGIDGANSVVLMNKGGVFQDTWSAQDTSVLADVNQDGMFDLLTMFNNAVYAEINTLASEHVYRSDLDGDTLIGSSGNDNLVGNGHGNKITGNGGDDVINGGTGQDIAAYHGTRAQFSISKTASGWLVNDQTGAEGKDSLSNVEQILFADKHVNLIAADAFKSISAKDLQTLEELYVAFFNRVPDADGLAYWAGQVMAGKTMQNIADSFYGAALIFSDTTGYKPDMTNDDFVKIIYKNVLNRSGATAPPDADVRYWSDELASGRASKSGLIATMLFSAHTFKGDATWGWVSDLLDNKIKVAHYFAVQQGLSFNSDTDSIVQGMAIAGAVTATDTSAALKLIGVSDAGFDLML